MKQAGIMVGQPSRNCKHRRNKNPHQRKLEKIHLVSFFIQLLPHFSIPKSSQKAADMRARKKICKGSPSFNHGRGCPTQQNGIEEMKHKLVSGEKAQVRY